MRIRNFLIACLASLTAIGAGATTSQAANVASLEVEVYDTNLNLYWANCEYSFDRSAWTGGSGSWSSEWSNFVETSGDCVTEGWNSYLEMDVTKTSLFGGVGTFQADVVLEYRVLSGLITCNYYGTVNGYWVNQPGSPDRKRFILPSNPLSKAGGSFLCPATPKIRSDTPALDVLADY